MSEESVRAYMNDQLEKIKCLESENAKLRLENNHLHTEVKMKVEEIHNLLDQGDKLNAELAKAGEE